VERVMKPTMSIYQQEVNNVPAIFN